MKLFFFYVKVAPNGVEYGEIAVTDGYGLPVKTVYHGACPSWNAQTSPKVLSNKYLNGSVKTTTTKKNTYVFHTTHCCF